MAVAAAHADAALPFYVRAAAACLILPNFLNIWWASVMLKGFAKLLKGGAKKKEPAQPQPQPQPAKAATPESGAEAGASKLQHLKAA